MPLRRSEPACELQQLVIAERQDLGIMGRDRRKTEALVKLQRAGMVERVGRNTHCLRIGVPSRIQCLQQKPFAQPQAKRMFEHAEMGEFDNILIHLQQFEKTGRGAVDIEHRDSIALVVQDAGKVGIAHPQPVDPVPAFADLQVEKAIEKKTEKTMGKVSEEYQTKIEKLAATAVKAIAEAERRVEEATERMQGAAWRLQHSKERVGDKEEGEIWERNRAEREATRLGEEDTYPVLLGKRATAGAGMTKKGWKDLEATRRVGHRAKQVLIDTVERGGQAFQGLERTDLIVAKANLAIEQLEKEDKGTEGRSEIPEGARLVAAQRMRNGGTILEMKTAEAAEWLRGGVTRDRFIRKLGGEMVVKDRL